jgi:hypothetical protein
MENQYIVLKNGKRMEEFLPQSLNQIIELVRRLELGLDRLTDHSPYTVDIAIS